ncbi:UDP-3-O-(3-hydroxymyristoyl)glucosamine N-acyltransferase [Oceanisphaera sp. KMM 10153]|uniref:UDP-3-O-(3-hydroxymyristoyl)glucosamine N-acyltransferase n=1 Tax=Oceanisphaera submarina TaxID=3390193 RepID=UPI0039764903
MGYKLKKPVQLSYLASRLSLQWTGFDVLIEGVAASSNVESSEITFSKNMPDKIHGAVVITPMQPNYDKADSNGFIIAENSRLAFIKALTFLGNEIGFSTWDAPAEIDPSAKIGQNVVIENGCVIGANSIIEHNVVLHVGTRIGKNSRIRSCSSIGGDGFGFERLDDGTPLRFPHLGGVLIGDAVEIGALNSIARGTLSDTIIRDHVKTDNLVHIAHNCFIDDGTLVAACAELSGGVRLGKRVWIGPNVAMMQKITVGDDALIGLGAVVTKNVPKSTVVAGNPAKKIRELM